MAGKRGRPSAYTEKLAKEICDRLITGMTLREVCRADDMPDESTVRTWAVRNYNGFFTQYAEAREIGYHCMADELLEIADDKSKDTIERDGVEMPNGEHMQRSRLRVDTRKWMLSKVLPKIYGEKQQLNHNHDISDPMKELLAHVNAKGGRIGGND